MKWVESLVRIFHNVTESSSLTLVNPTSIEGELPEERLFRKYAHIIRNWDPEKQDKFLNKRKYYRPRKMNRFKHVVDTNEISTKEEIQAVKEVFKNADISQTYRNVVVPTKIIAGEFGERTTRLEAKRRADLIQNADFEVYQESSAFPFVEEQEDLSKIQLHLSTNITMKSMFNF